MIESMYFVLSGKKERVEVQIKVDKGFVFNLLDLEFAHYYDAQGNEGITIRHTSGEYTRVHVKDDNMVDDNFESEYYIRGYKIKFKAMETSHWLWHHEVRCWGKK